MLKGFMVIACYFFGIIMVVLYGNQNQISIFES